METREYAITGEGSNHLIEQVTVERQTLKVGEIVPACISTVLDTAAGHAARLGIEVDVRAHNQWWAPSYTCHPDGSVWYHATGRKAGWIRRPLNEEV